MTYEITEIKDIRRKLSITQSELAKRSGVSQSLIAKIESNRLDPTYTNVKKIFSALDLLTHKKETKAEEIMNKKIVSVGPEDLLRDVIKKMKQYEISQVPVMEKDVPVGLVSETSILNKLTGAESGGDPSKVRVREIMEECPPIVTKSASSRVVSDLLKFYPVVLITGGGKLCGLITKSDILRNIGR